MAAVIATLGLPAAASAADITFQSYEYTPSAVRIVPGDSVKWTGSFNAHPLVSDEGLWTTKQDADPSFTHVFAAAGRFAFHCQFHGASVGMKGTVTVTSNQPPVAAFTVSPASPASGETVTFDASSSSDDHGIASYEWDLDGNGTFEQTGKVVTSSYTGPKTVTVRLRVTDDNADAVGAEAATTTKSVTIAAPPSGGGSGTPTTTSPTPPPPPPPTGGGGGAADTQRPVVSVRPGKANPLKLRIRSSEAGRATAKLKAGGLTLAGGKLTFSAAGERTLTLRLSKAASRKLRRAGRLRAKLTVVVTDAAGNATTVKKTVTLRRR